MARKRMLSPEIWDNDRFGSLSLLAKIIWIGMISNADDEGRGRAAASYLKGRILPYDELRIADIDKALLEISQKMSVKLYEIEGSRFYELTHWQNWQSLNRPTKSKLPAPPDCGEGEIILNSENSLSTHEQLTEYSLLEKKGKEKKGIEEKGNISKKECGETFDELIDKYTVCKELKDSLVEFIKMRKLIKKPMTNKALELIFEKLDKLASSDTEKVEILNQSICNSWQGVFELKNDRRKNNEVKGQAINYDEEW